MNGNAWDGTNYYEFLGVAPNASLTEINKAFKVRARALHPDLNPRANPRDMQILNQAKEWLSDEVLRRELDEGLRRQPSAGAGPNKTGGKTEAPKPQSASKPSHTAIRHDETITLTLPEAYVGCNKTITFRGRKKLVKIPPNMYGPLVRLSGSVLGIEEDLVIPVQRVDDPIFRLVAGDFRRTLRVSELEVLLGATVKFRHLDGRLFSLKLPKQNRKSLEFNFPNGGPVVKGVAGSLKVKIKIVKIPPGELNPKALKLLADLEAELYGAPIRK